ncbi:hypothetical protein KQH49_14500 [Mycetohabitans sp. B5]|uniref:YXWGXW repeat-containing protein n=1 Tax=Mycetohabitans endofungorum TaxID=417203 RepID=A0A2P5K7I6_9BURK|nr:MULTISPECIES: hypothetical protein [Mycetohabitans]MCG1056061.1 hypothetical protein [Mycetohabitans sp. B5]PPB82036.1 hypothetical protein B0O95_1143 [Mycetohabitans endofungorum]
MEYAIPAIRRLRALVLTVAVPAALAACVVEPARPPQPAPVVEVLPGGLAPGYHWSKGHYRWD